MKTKIAIGLTLLASASGLLLLRSNQRDSLYRVGDEPVTVSITDWTFPSLPRPTATPPPAMPHAHKVRPTLTLEEEKASYEQFQREYYAAKVMSTRPPDRPHGLLFAK